jgi:hypothetical protein
MDHESQTVPNQVAEALMPDGLSMADVMADNARSAAAARQDAVAEAMADAECNSHRGLKNGRNFMWNVFRHRSRKDMDNYRENFDNVFPNSPGAGF